MNYIYTYNELILEQSKIKDKVKNLLSQLKINPSKRLIKILAVSLISVYSYTQIQTILNQESVDNTIQNEILSELGPNQLKKGYDFVLSQKGWDFIRDEEKLRLKAYNIGDGMITIGWGHAEPIDKSKYEVGDKITIEEAQKLLIQDVNLAAKGVKRIFKQWEGEGNIVYITQNQYDAMVSMAFNMGVGGLRTSEFIQEVKKGDMKKAEELIPKTKLKSGFSGLIKRRKNEQKMFSGISLNFFDKNF